VTFTSVPQPSTLLGPNPLLAVPGRAGRPCGRVDAPTSASADHLNSPPIAPSFYISAWVTDDQDGSVFEEHVPLLYSARYLRMLGSTQEFTVLFLDGYRRLPAGYVTELARLGFHVVDVSGDYRAVAAPYSALDRFGSYEKLCFLRWRVLERYLETERVQGQVLHVDGDVMFGATPERISAECAGRTFVQQGCPFFAAIADNDWLRVYADELERFSRDISGYSARAWEERVGWNGGCHAWVGWWERDPLSSDQDLIQYLIHSGKLPHTDPAEFRAASDLHYVHNPLYFHTHADLSLGKTSGVEFRSDGRACFVDGRQIAFWHFQQSFVHYMRQCEVLLRLRWPFVLPNPLESSDRTRRWVSRVVRPGSRASSYRVVRELALDPADARFGFADVFNRHAYWKRGFFSNGPAS
jgi:hypothetical protein